MFLTLYITQAIAITCLLALAHADSLSRNMGDNEPRRLSLNSPELLPNPSRDMEEQMTVVN